ncbi:MULTISPECIES: DUF1285 domain-containing protein [Pseudoalteromonas]|uniref:DUF1285 domain-containing protein n=1 Tax=Pseudoalteromonas obscura TaxID=3048491 RepID=A0ABT7EPY4_9GAMM|nr:MULTISPECIES: DUF1285 domain-containing protein [Pseudoalteromonas]MBQ4839444.1 DUF1285 domain-containing protein [Pseudoalteromonas luteoviolacea]MDK2597116.1 DUF1285 domain-containing protein [Pseudoalteromonas sp. P94(2023)]
MTSKLEQLLAHYVSSHSPTERWQAGECGVGEFLIDASGRWYHQGDEIKRLALVKLFASVLCREDGAYRLKTPTETCVVSVDASPFVIVAWHECQIAAQYGIAATIICEDNLGRFWPICDTFPLYLDDYKGQQIPHLKLNYGLHARIDRNVFYQWVEIAELNEQNDMMLLRSAGKTFELN